MTYRDDTPQPSCPLCGTNEHSGRDTIGDRNTRPVYYCNGPCGGCVFDGSQDEWHRSAEARDRLKARREVLDGS